MGNPSILQVIIKVSKQGTGDKEAAAEAKNLKGALNELGLGSLGTMGALGALSAVVGMTTKFTKEAVDGTVKYANEIRGLKLLTGENAEETGKVIQVMDDFKVKTESLTAAQKQLSKGGLSLNIETLARLSDEYRTLGSGAEKTRFLLDKFGKSGLQFAEAMETGGDALRQMSRDVNANLLLTDEQLQQAREYEKALDSLQETWQGFSMMVGTTAIPILTSWIETAKKMDWRNLVPVVGSIKLLTDYGDSYNELKAKTINATAAEQAHTQAMKDAGPTTEELAAQAKELSSALKDQLGLMFDLQGETDKFAEKQSDLKQKQGELSAQLMADPSNEKLQKDLADTNAALEENIQKHEEASRRIIFSMLQQQLAADGLDKADFTALTSIAVQWGLLDENVAKQAGSIQDSIQKYLDTKDLATFNGEVERTLGLPSTKTFVFHVDTIYSSSGYGSGTGQGAADDWLKNNGYAEGTGGWMEVPPGYQNDSYPIRLSSGEKFAVIPAGGGPMSSGQPMSAGGSVNVYLTYAPTISLASEAEINERLLPFIREGIRSVSNGR